MYDEHFGLTGRPFQLTPDPAFWYETATHRRAMAYLGYGLAQGEGFIVITGDIGAGKTTLMGHLLDTLDREALNPIKIVSTAIEASDLLRIVAAQLGVDPAGLEKAQLLTAIERGLHAVARTGRRTLLIVDEAQALPTSALEELRMLSNFQAGGHALLQIVLLGQPEFRSALQGSERLEQLRQRVIAIHHLDPMAVDEVAPYVRHRLNVVGWSDRPAFAASAFPALHRLSDGVPRRLNQLANRVMLHAAVEGIATITAATVDLVAADLFADLPTTGRVAGDVSAPVVAVERSEPVDEVRSVPPTESQPRPFRHSWLDLEIPRAEPVAMPSEPEAAPLAPEHVALVPETPRPEVEAPAAMTVEPEPHTVASSPVITSAESDPALLARVADLESRMEEQDAALRRVLTLLVDWVEADQAPRPASAPVSNAPALASVSNEEPRGYVPIRGAAA